MRKKNSYRDKVETIIGRNTTVSGEIYVTGSLRIEGNVEGNIKSSGDIYVGEEGLVVASIHARNIVIAGEIRGDIDVIDKIEIVSSGKLLGNIIMNRFILSEGATFKGEKTIRD